MLSAGNKSELDCNCDHQGKAALSAAAGLAVGKSTHGSVRASRVCEWVHAWDGCLAVACCSPGIAVLPAVAPVLSVMLGAVGCSSGAPEPCRDAVEQKVAQRGSAQGASSIHLPPLTFPKALPVVLSPMRHRLSPCEKGTHAVAPSVLVAGAAWGSAGWWESSLRQKPTLCPVFQAGRTRHEMRIKEPPRSVETLRDLPTPVRVRRVWQGQSFPGASLGLPWGSRDLHCCCAPVKCLQRWCSLPMPQFPL